MSPIPGMGPYSSFILIYVYIRYESIEECEIKESLPLLGVAAEEGSQYVLVHFAHLEVLLCLHLGCNHC